ncbi:Arginine/ornithine antiporter ArcD [Candidatus Rhodobacter oscarellae]|uniref:Arginine/ornithine antiporter ArcD n=1 Tax=Candidatus Rhodobacter oscarellae TaxID=1675527 RepID=A0A0J9E6Q7_9RHOB|nr:ceramidase domain-containing protein [Candidatus Rhodobacter lobularis]KMW58460.1 Arginine/ornithine antiporter ArcD [Candidatus Rhodobacter lobularis]
MDWTQALDGYCERVGPEYWSEPVNALTNLAFLVAALVMWRRVTDPLGRLLCILLGMIGIGSYLFHTHAQIWSALADVGPIVGFILVYVYAANLHFWNMSRFWSGIGVLLFFPYVMGAAYLFNALPFFHISAGYWPVALLIGGYGFALRHRAKRTAGGLALGAAILALSLFLRSIDEMVCAQLPVGTHFLWHILNGIMLGWMIEVHRRHIAENRASA